MTYYRPAKVDSDFSYGLGTVYLLLGIATGLMGGPLPLFAIVLGTGLALALMGWRMDPLREVRAKHRRERAKLMRLLHRSSAWHCGCAYHVAERARLRGDVRRKVIPGPWPAVVETWKPSDEELDVFYGDKEK